MLNKRLIIFILAISGVLIIAGFILWLLFKTPTKIPITEKPAPEEEITIPITPQTEGEFTIFKLSDVAVISPIISDNKVLYYSKLNGNVLKTDFEGKSIQPLTNIAIPNLITTVWSFDKSQTINIYQENDVVKKVLFDFASQKATQLDSKIKSVSFAPNQNKIAYQFIDDSLGKNTITIADSNGLNWKDIFNIRMENIRLYWTKDNLLTLTSAPSGIVKGSALTIDTTPKIISLKKLISDIYGLTIKYSPDGKNLIYSQTDQYGHNPTLHLIKEGGVAEKTNLNTLSDKCAFSKNNNIYCAIPKIINGSLILPDDFYKNIANFSDIFFKIDMANNKSSIIFDPADFKYDFNASDLNISPNEDYIIFINKKDGLLYSIKIK
ncbi:MAG: hypothetical protein US61_C0025G0009 [Parcubacteria group bacterium GW2011_GWE2_37_8]|nr:MAG: hypothetical protein US61_C0025G0009 [Parcubacteria group bacterium GW2011_GWE2_37_8]